MIYSPHASHCGTSLGPEIETFASALVVELIAMYLFAWSFNKSTPITFELLNRDPPEKSVLLYG